MSNRLQALAILIACVGAGWGTDWLARSWGDASYEARALALRVEPASRLDADALRSTIAGEVK